MGFEIALMVVGALIALVGLYSLGVSVWLMCKYVKFNKRNNFAGLTGEETARRILDSNGLYHIAVKSTGSIMFGNSYSHFFKKVRIRRFTRHERSLTALRMLARIQQLFLRCIGDLKLNSALLHISQDQGFQGRVAESACNVKIDDRHAQSTLQLQCRNAV